MTQPAAKAGKNETMTSNDDGSRKTEGEASEADFEAAYSADAESEAKATASETPKSDIEEGEGDLRKDPAGPTEAEAKLSSDPEAEGDTDVTTKVAADRTPTDAPATKPKGADTSELAFAQRIQSEQKQGDVEVLPASTAGNRQAGSDAPQPTTVTKGQAADQVAANGLLAKKAMPVDPQTGRGPAQSTPPAVPQSASDAALPSAGTELPAEGELIPLPRARRKRDDALQASSLRETSATPTPPAKTTAPPPVPATPPLVNPALPMQAEITSVDLQLLPVGDLDAPSSWDSRGPTPASLAQTLARPETPGMIGRQMAEALQRFPDRPVELSLNPKELGRVQLSIAAAESGITVQVLAERPETLDLMRRNIDQLAREFEALGYDSINFAFNEGQTEGDPSEGTDRHEHAAPLLGAGEPEAETAIPVTMTASTGVDIRV